ncbi:hypothetical protein GCM10007049_39070 [Echinicola pacifica]|uniref:Starch-binding associating with outer membrane n=1 Tax=Echinicola pacifica TaxID=346377 RepID=A0A918UXN8_9BACT|nr:RagB/SusD family nutrient uptake outer membrane protein [Echinicola pacifica]GGZ42036.1 hypothetical protein GCM10007049_39070 [Echinicola pacifica]
MKFILNTYIKRSLILIALIGLASSCDVIDLTPANLIPDDEAFSTEPRIESAVLGVYESAQIGFYNDVVQRGYPFGAANVEQGDLRGEDLYNDQLFYEITYTGSYSPTSANNNGMWISLYRMINRLNIILEKLDPAFESGLLTADTRDNYRGELLFLRALSHHELLVHFARPYMDDPSLPGVPYRIFGIDEVAKISLGEMVRRGTVGEDYDQLLADLDQAEDLINEGGTFRASWGAVIALKTRIKLHKGDWQGVLDEFKKLEGKYAITSDPAAPFRSGGQSTDNIFSFLNSAESNPGTNGALPAMLGNPNTGGRGLVKISPLIWRADFWMVDDTRRKLTSSGGLGVYTTKYVDATSFSDPNVILRYSEAVLNAAEASARLNDLAAAVTLVNLVRDRSIPSTAASYTVAGLEDQNSVIQAILNEKRIEFLAEGKRFGDIHRLSGEGRMNGVPPKASSRSITNVNFYTTDREIPLSHAIPYTSTRFIWPIPLDEIQNNGLEPIEQNPGYF